MDPPLEWDVKTAVEYAVEMADNDKLKDLRESAMAATRRWQNCGDQHRGRPGGTSPSKLSL